MGANEVEIDSKQTRFFLNIEKKKKKKKKKKVKRIESDQTGKERGRKRKSDLFFLLLLSVRIIYQEYFYYNYYDMTSSFSEDCESERKRKVVGATDRLRRRGGLATFEREKKPDYRPFVVVLSQVNLPMSK